MPFLRCLRFGRLLYTLLIIFLFLFIIIFVSFIIYWTRWPNFDAILQQKTCPLCYGTDFCPQFYNKSVTFSNDYVDVFTSYVNVKNVYKAKYNGRKLIIKKLAHNWELRKINERACKNLNICDGNYSTLPTSEELLTDIKHMVDYERNKLSVTNFVVCPDRNSIELLIKPIISKEPSSKTQELLQVWTMLSINAEPVILKYLNLDKNSWAVPKYYGACGRSVSMEYAGTPLYSFNYKDYYQRMDISVKLIDLAQIFTFQHPLFRFYLTDLSVDNIVINDSGYPIIVDMENVIVLDKLTNMDRLRHWKEDHSSEVFQCEGCFSFSTEEICTHHLSDHNIYAFCTLIKEDILTDNSTMPEINTALSECINPVNFVDRFKAADALVNKMKDALKMRHDEENLKRDRELRHTKDY